MAGAAPTITITERRARLGRRHLLDAPGTSVDDVAEALVGLHSSDPITPYLSLRARLPTIKADEITDALYTERSLMRVHAMRRTMFVAPRDLASTMTAACTAAYATRERTRLVAAIAAAGITRGGTEGALLERLAEKADAALRARGEATTLQLVADVPDLSLRVTYGSGTRWASTLGLGTKLLFLLALEGRIARSRPVGSWLSSQYRWLPIEAFVDELGSGDPAAARAELARRWLASYGPGSTVDLQWWSGWTKAQTLAALDGCDAVHVALEGVGAGWALPGDSDHVAEDGEFGEGAMPDGSWAALLPGLDPTPMGWKQRDWYVAPEHVGALYDRNGNAGPIVMVDGRAVGGWSQAPTGEIRVRILDDVGSELQSMIDTAVAELVDWLGETRLTHRFRSPLDLELARS